MDLTARAAQLSAERRPFVRATVVRAQKPTSARSGDCALVLGDGTIEGFVGGQCTENSVRVAAREALDTGESVLLRVLPGDALVFPDAPGATVAVNPCQSGGAMEIFLEPQLPAPILVISGTSPIADAVVAFGRILDLDVVRLPGTDVPDGAAAVVVASLGGEEAAVIRAGLDAGAGYIGLVASRARGPAVLEQLDVTAAELARIHTPAGLDIGARTAAEIALSIVADVVRTIRSGSLAPTAPAPQPVTATDPVCGMTVTVTDTTPHLRVDGRDVWFCCPGCRRAYEKEHAA
ncbi:carbon monoxide dehydrogenase accessory protein [Rhodococcus zopfii]|uniref:Carbon monoxide dehydrogenase accessory protein n=1 Tax=Rhodococcus zopfii TaxID=43772 RepID=A0ABU3WQX8_9NOCA|nr:carbon monoxide dehydrogenase accessory protein [Rhodococcus zopfii]